MVTKYLQTFYKRCIFLQHFSSFTKIFVFTNSYPLHPHQVNFRLFFLLLWGLASGVQMVINTEGLESFGKQQEPEFNLVDNSKLPGKSSKKNKPMISGIYERNNFKPVKRKRTFVMDTAQSTSENEQSFHADAVVSEVYLYPDVLYKIMIHLSTKDILRCLQVCRLWKTVLSEKSFWINHLCHHYDFTLKTNIAENYDNPMIAHWSDPDNWFCYYENDKDPYVMRPMPSIWECGVVHPSGLDPMAGDLKSLQGFSRSLELLSYMKKGITMFRLLCGNECSADEGAHYIEVVLFPWNEEELPEAKTILDEIFHFHPEILEEYVVVNSTEGTWKNDKLYYHLPKVTPLVIRHQRHNMKEKPCLNRIFGFGSKYEEGEDKSPQKVDQFYSWLQSIMVPTITIFAGEGKFNSVAVFCLTKLAPGWVGGALTGVTYT